MTVQPNNIISMAIAHRIWSAHREIETATKMLADIREDLQRRQSPTQRDVFGRQHRNFEFGVPSGRDGHRLFGVTPKLALHVIEAHIAETRRELAEACVVARMELDGLLSQEL